MLQQVDFLQIVKLEICKEHNLKYVKPKYGKNIAITSSEAFCTQRVNEKQFNLNFGIVEIEIKLFFIYALSLISA